MAKASKFGNELRIFSEDVVPDALDSTTEDTLTQVLKGVIKRTPVLTGTARANWLVVNSSQSSNFVDRQDTDGDATIAAGIAKIKQALKSNTKKISIVNSAPYITDLENGSSRKAPAGMVAVTLATLK